MAIVLMLLVAISPLVGMIPASKQLIYGKHSFFDTLPMALLLGLFGLFYVPIPEVDLTRYFTQLDVIRGFSTFSQFFQSLDLTQRVQVSQQVFFYGISRLSWNNLLPFFVVVSVAVIGFYIIKDFTQERDCDSKFKFLIYLAFIMLMPWGQVITNIRYILSVAVFMFAFYRDVFQGKHNIWTWILYFVGCTLHITTIVFMALRVGWFFLQKINSSASKQQRLLILAGLLILLLIFSRTSIFAMVLNKGLFYLNGGGEGSNVQQWFAQADRSLGRSLGKRIEMGFLLTQVIIMGSAFLNALKDHMKLDAKYLTVYGFSLVFMLMTLFWTFLSGTTWIRFAFLVDFCAVFIMDSEERYLRNQYLVLLNQTAWIGMLLWSVIWQVYQYTGSEMMTRVDFYNILFPFRWFIG